MVRKDVNAENQGGQAMTGTADGIEIGATVGVDCNGWRTGIFRGVVEKTKTHQSTNFGMYRIKLNFVKGDEVLVRPECVRLISAADNQERRQG